MDTDMLLAATEALCAALPHDPSATVVIGYGTRTEAARYATTPGWTVHVPGHPDEVRQAVADAVARGARAYIDVSGRCNSEPHSVGGFELVREGLQGVVLAVGATLDSVLRATAGTDLAILYAVTIRPFDEVALRTAVLAAHHADVVLVEPRMPGISASHIARTLVHVPHRLLALGDEDALDEEKITQAVRDFVR